MKDSVKLTVRLPREDLDFAKRYAQQHGITVTEFLDRYLRRMRAMEASSLVPEIEAISGLVPADIDAEVEAREHRILKHSS